MERLIKYFEPSKYILNIYIDKNEKIIEGKVTVTGEALSETVKFHAVGLKITGVEVNGNRGEFRVKDDIIEVEKVSTGVAEITIYYNGALNENMQGAYISTYEHDGKTETIVATQFESHFAREAFPCIDEPEAKAVFELSITTPDDSDDIILTNVPMGEPTPRMSTYLLAWVIGPLQGKSVTNKYGTEITTYCSLAQDVGAVDFANEVAAKALEFYEDNFGVKYPLPRLVQVALPDFEAGAMENWGLVTYRESMMLVGKTATLDTKKMVALTVTHELSHQWFGNLVTMKWWDELWLNESFASVMEYYATDYIFPEYRIWEDFFTGDCYEALVRDAYSDVQSVHQEVHDPAEIATLFDGAIVYSKGAHLMLMLIRLMGWSDFCAGCRDYFEKHKYKNTVGDDLWRALSAHAKFDVGALMHAFIDQPGYPVIASRGKNAGSSEYFALPETKFAEVTQKRFLLDSNKMPESDWPLPEIAEDMSGHYVLNLSETEFEARLTDFEKLGLEEKLRLLIDRALVARTELAESASLLPLVQKFADETSAAVWEIIATIIGQLKIFIEPDSEEEGAFKRFVGELVAPGLERIGIKTRKNDDGNTLRLRALLLGLDYYAENKTHLLELAEMYSADYTALDPEMRGAILDAKMYMDPEVIDDYLVAYQQTADPDIKRDLRIAGTLSKDDKVLARMVKLLDQPEIVKLQDQLFLFVRLYRNRKSRQLTWQWMVDNWDKILETVGWQTIDRYPRYTANIIRTQEEYDQWREFFEPKSDEPGLKRAIEIGAKEIEARLELIAADRVGVLEALREIDKPVK